MNSTNYKSYVILLFCILLNSCYPPLHLTTKKYTSQLRPPGTIKISDSLYCDETEVTNTDYREYLYWTSHVYGDTSIEYKDAEPDTLVWMRTPYTCLYSLARYYFRHPVYQNYPVVGVSQKQARNYSKWRSDRVMEYILVRLKKFNWDSSADRNTCFTIQRYFSGQYHNLTPDTNIKYYPEYSLPSRDEFLFAVHFSDSADAREKHFFIQESIIPCNGDSLLNDPMIPVFAGYHNALYNLEGNVREWLSENNAVLGGAWNEHYIPNYLYPHDSLSIEDAYTGFRNVCRWVKIKKDY